MSAWAITVGMKDEIICLMLGGTKNRTRTLPSPFADKRDHCRTVSCSAGWRVCVTICNIHVDLNFGEGAC